MSTLNGTKQSIKRLELPISKFNDVAIPHHLDLLKKHKHNINKFRSLRDWDQVYKEQVNASRIVKQLKQLLHDMDILRSQVLDNDIAAFDRLTTQSRTSTIQAIKEYLELEFQLPLVKPSPVIQQDDFEENPLDDAAILQSQLSEDQEELERQQACLHAWNNLHQDLEQLHQLYVDFNQVVADQKEDIEKIENNVEEAQVNVHEGRRFLQTALKYKKMTYPVAGAVLGACMGGPIGLIAGIKLGGLSAACGGILGFTSGQLLKNKQIRDSQTAEEVEEQKPLDSKLKSS